LIRCTDTEKAAEDLQRLFSAEGINDRITLTSGVSEPMTLAQSRYDAMLTNRRNPFEAMSDYNVDLSPLSQESRVQLKAELDKRTALICETTSLLDVALSPSLLI